MHDSPFCIVLENEIYEAKRCGWGVAAALAGGTECGCEGELGISVTTIQVFVGYPEVFVSMKLASLWA